MRYSWTGWTLLASVGFGVAGCASAPAPPTASAGRSERAVTPLERASQLVLVVTPGWDATSGTLRRFERDADGAAWRPVGPTVPIVVGQTGLAWDASQAGGPAGAPIKREGDGKAPAGAFAMDGAFGFAERQTVPWIRLPYTPLRTTTECVDDPRSVHYNSIVDRGSVPRVDWASSERMRGIEQYALGITVAYNATPRVPARGSCIFLHIWAGPGSVTAGCTAMERTALDELLRWLDPTRRPLLVQLPASERARLGARWGLPAGD